MNEPTPPPPNLDSIEQWQLLVVDDDADAGIVTSLAFKRANFKDKPFTLKLVTTTPGALEALRTETFHVVLVDMVMEDDHSGLTVCRAVRELQPAWTRIILRTGKPDEIDPEIVSNPAYGIALVLAKGSVTREKLHASVTGCLEKILGAPPVP